MEWMAGAWAVFEKDLKLELRTRYAVNTLLLFVAGAALIVAFAMGRETISPQLQSALLWVVILFAASIGLGRAFVSEEEQHTALLLRIHAAPSMVYAGKLLYNLLLTLGLNLAALGLYLVLLRVDVVHADLLIASLVLGALGLAGATTLLAAIIARASNRGPLLPVLLFPILVPHLVSVVHATRHAFEGGFGWAAALQDVVTLVAFAGATISASVLLFDHVWMD